MSILKVNNCNQEYIYSCCNRYIALIKVTVPVFGLKVIITRKGIHNFDDLFYYVPYIHDLHNLDHVSTPSDHASLLSQAFGTGALEEEDGDDDNVYGVETMTSYDVSLAQESDLSIERSFGWTGRENG